MQTTSRRLAALAALVAGCQPPAEPPPDPGPAVAAPARLVIAVPGVDRRIEPVLRAYAREAGIEVESVEAATDPTAGDLYLGTSFVELWGIAERDGFRPLPPDPGRGYGIAALRDPESRWIVLGTRPRMVVANAGRVEASSLQRLTTYADLATEEWRGRLCLSSFAVAGNRLLVAELIRTLGLRDAELAVRGWMANLARPVYTSDDELRGALVRGDCDIAIVAVGPAWLNRPPDAVALHRFAGDTVTVVDVSGIGIARHTGAPDVAAEFVDWLGEAAPNALYAAERDEFPAAPGRVADVTTETGRAAPLAELGFLLEEAGLLAERARYR